GYSGAFWGVGGLPAAPVFVAGFSIVACVSPLLPAAMALTLLAEVPHLHVPLGLFGYRTIVRYSFERRPYAARQGKTGVSGASRAGGMIEGGEQCWAEPQ